MKTKDAVVIAVLVVAGAGFQGLRWWFVHRGEQAATEGAKDAAPKIEKAIVAAEARTTELRSAIAKAHAAGLSGTGACPTKVPAPPLMNGQQKTSFESGQEAVAALAGGQAWLRAMTVIDQKHLEELESPAARMELPSMRGLLSEAKSSSPPSDLAARADKLALKEPWDLVVVQTEYELPIANAKEGTFKPGHLRGRAYLYEYATKKVTCVGEVDATNTDSVKYSVGKEIAGVNLDRDLRTEALRDAAAHLIAVP